MSFLTQVQFLPSAPFIFFPLTCFNLNYHVQSRKKEEQNGRINLKYFLETNFTRRQKAKCSHVRLGGCMKMSGSHVCAALSITTGRSEVLCRFCDGEIGRAELEKRRQRETRLRRPAGLVSHSPGVATPNYPILRPSVQTALSLWLCKAFFVVARRRPPSKRARTALANVPPTWKLNKFYDTGFKFKSFLRQVCRERIIVAQYQLQEKKAFILLIFWRMTSIFYYFPFTWFSFFVSQTNLYNVIYMLPMILYKILFAYILFIAQNLSISYRICFRNCRKESREFL